METDYEYLVKVIIVGETGVGKTCILQRYLNNEFSVDHLPTIAIDFKMKLLQIRGKSMKLQIWDTAGQERFDTLTAAFFRCKVISSPRDHRYLLRHRPKVLSVYKQMDAVDPKPGAKEHQSDPRWEQGRHCGLEDNTGGRGERGG